MYILYTYTFTTTELEEWEQKGRQSVRLSEACDMNTKTIGIKLQKIKLPSPCIYTCAR